MLWFVAKRCILMVAMLLGLLVITFSISHIAPGDPAALAAGPDASKEMMEMPLLQSIIETPIEQPSLDE